MSSRVKPSVGEFYSNKSIFITGGSGMLGKCLVRRILDTTSPASVYILFRGKREVNFDERFKKYLLDEAFDTLENKEAQLAKLIPIEGDIELPRLGLSDSDHEQVTQNAQIVFHSAATVKWNEELRTAINVNIRGTQQVLDLCRAMKNHCLLMHMSSYACWMEMEVLEEKVYRSQWNPKDLIQDAEGKTDQEMAEMTNDYIGPKTPMYCNSYVFTKTMTEVLIAENAGSLNVVIARLPLFAPSAQSPFQGWVEALQINNATLVAGVAGLMRGFYQEATYPVKILPVDLVCNSIITSAWESATAEQYSSPMVYNLTPSREQSTTLYELLTIAGDLGTRYPSVRQILPPYKFSRYQGAEGRLSFLVKQNLLLLYVYLLQMLSVVFAKKTVSLVKVVKSLNTGLWMLFFGIHDWILNNNTDHVTHLYSDDGPLTKEERDKFYFKPDRVNYRDIYKEMYLNFRRNVLKEPDSNFEEARQRLERFKILLDMIKYFVFAIVSAYLAQPAITLLGF